MPTLYAQPNSVPVGTAEVVPINIGFAAYLQPGDAISSAAATLLDEIGTVITLVDQPTIVRSNVIAPPVSTVSSFGLPSGLGAVFLGFSSGPLGAGMVLTVGAQLATVQSIIADVVTLSSPLSYAPRVGDLVTSAYVQQPVRGSQLTAKHAYRLDMTAVLNAAKTMTVSIAIPCPY